MTVIDKTEIKRNWQVKKRGSGFFGNRASPYENWGIAALFMAPALIVMFMFVVYPAFYALYLSFTNASLIRLQWDFVGLRNFINFFNDSSALAVLGNTYKYVIVVIIFQFLIGFGLALTLNSVKVGRGIYGALLFLPWVFSEVTAVAVWKWFFNDTYGVINYYLQAFGALAPHWLSNPDLAMVTVMVLNIWKGYPFSMVLLLAGLQNIPTELYEAARIDGAGRGNIFRFITLPLMRPVMISNFILITIYTFNIFSLVYAMTGGGPAGATEIIGLYMYKLAFNSSRLGAGSAVAVLMFLLNLAITMIYIFTLYNPAKKAQ